MAEFKLDPEYSIHKFYTQASDGFGHPIRVATSFSRAELELMQEIADVIPAYKGSVQNFMRDALYHEAARYILHEKGNNDE